MNKEEIVNNPINENPVKEANKILHNEIELRNGEELKKQVMENSEENSNLKNKINNLKGTYFNFKY